TRPGTRGGGTSMIVQRGRLGFGFGRGDGETVSSFRGVRAAGRPPSASSGAAFTAGTNRGVGEDITAARSSRPRRRRPLHLPPGARSAEWDASYGRDPRAT